MDKPKGRAGRPPAIDDHGRQVLLDMYDKGHSQQEIAEALNTSRRTVAREGAKLGVSWTMGPRAENQAVSTKARIDSIREKRAILMDKLLDDAEELRNQLLTEYEDSAFVGGQSPTHLKATLKQPKAADQAHVVRAIESIMRRVNDVLADPADATDTAASVLGQLATALTEAHEKNKQNVTVPGLEDDLQQDAPAASDEKPELDDAVVTTFSELDSLDREMGKHEAKPTSSFCDLPVGDCLNKARPHLRGAGPCKLEPLTADEDART